MLPQNDRVYETVESRWPQRKWIEDHPLSRMRDRSAKPLCVMSQNRNRSIRMGHDARPSVAGVGIRLVALVCR